MIYHKATAVVKKSLDKCSMRSQQEASEAGILFNSGRYTAGTKRTFKNPNGLLIMIKSKHQVISYLSKHPTQVLRTSFCEVHLALTLHKITACIIKTKHLTQTTLMSCNAIANII